MKDKPYYLSYDDRIALLTQMFLDIGVNARRFNRNADYNELMVTLVLAWGRSTGKMLDITSTAEFLELPRTTVKRVLDRLVESGDFVSARIGRRKVFYRDEKSMKGVRGAEFELMFVYQMRWVTRAARLLSKMEGSAVA